MRTVELNTILFGNRASKRYFVGTFPACEIPISNKHRYCFVTNTEEHDKPGEHWNAWFVRDNSVLFFDSFGRYPWDQSFPHDYSDFIRKFDIVEYTTTAIQAFESTLCGLFCIHFIYEISFGLDFSDFLNEYYRNVNLNDDVVISFINSII